MKRSLLITGGAGFIGSHFVHHWADRHPDDRLLILDLLTYAGRRSNLAGLERDARITFVQGDVCDAARVDELMRRHCVDTLVNFAAESHVDRSISAPGEFVRTNITGTYVLLEACRRVWESRDYKGCRYHQISTDEVYGALAPDEPPAKENRLCEPNSPYAASKAAADHLVRAYGRTYGLPITISRSPNNYGPRQYPEKLVPVVLRAALNGQPIPIYGDGQQVRDWIHVQDHCAGVAATIERGVEGEIYNLGAHCELKNSDLVHTLCAAIDECFERDARLAAVFPEAPGAKRRPSESLMAQAPDRPGHDRRCAIDASKARSELEFKASRPLHEGLAETARWYIDNREWWQRPSARD